MNKVIAHKNDVLGITQTLESHLISVAKRSKKQSKYPYTSYLVGLLHDIGKADPLWQKYIRGQVNQTINHTSAGGKYLYDYEGITGIFSGIYKQVLAYVITSHHGQYDIYDLDNTHRMNERLNYNQDTRYTYSEVERYVNTLVVKNSIDLDDVIKRSYSEFETWILKTFKQEGYDKQRKMFEITILIRYLLSILKDADIQDSIMWDQDDSNIQKTDWVDEVNEIEQIYNTFTSDTTLNKVRTQISQTALEQHNQYPNGVIELKLPTGSGKTLTALRYAVNHSKHYQKERIIYVAPFLSILEQNAQVIRDAIKKDEIINEHHSNVSETVEQMQKGFTHKGYDTVWEEPIVLTTLVQFFNTLFGIKADNYRRFSNLQNSVIILDEIQTIPTKFYYLFNSMVTTLARDYNCVVILCTATQPNLDSKDIKHRITYRQPKELVGLDEQQDLVFQRVKDTYLGEVNVDDLINHTKNRYINGLKSILYIFNTKKKVKEFYDLLNTEFGHLYKVIYLTTNMYASHRLNVIHDVKKDLEDGLPIIVVSTNLVEAGVDFDFDVVYRDIASISSLIQARGRCNRNGTKEIGEFNIFDIRDTGLGSLADIKEGAGITKTILMGIPETTNLDIEQYNNDYYRVLNKKHNANRVMAYRFKGRNGLASYAYDLLACNDEVRGLSKNELKSKINLKQSFKTSGQNIKLIDNETYSVIVETHENQTLINELRNKYKYGVKQGLYQLIKKLQVYTLSVYNIDKLRQYIEILGDNEVYVLQSNYYDDIIGLNIHEETMKEIMLEF